MIGPLVLLLHGFPECWYSWRHQFAALAEAGYHVVAPDQRGYGRSDRPAQVEEYTIMHLVGDAIGLIRALGERQAVIIGHDLGCRVARSAALMRPDVVRGSSALASRRGSGRRRRGGRCAAAARQRIQDPARPQIWCGHCLT